MLSPAFESTSYLPITLLPALSPSPFSPSPLSQSTTSDSCSTTTRKYPRSPCTPRATPRPRLSAVLSSSPYFSPSNPFSARPPPGALSARYTIINTLSAGPSEVCTTPSRALIPDARDGSRTLRQRGRSENSSLLGVELISTSAASEGIKENNGAKAVGKRVVGMAGWVILGMVVSLAVLSLRAGLEASGGSAGGVGTVHIEWDTEARARDLGDVWAIAQLEDQVAGQWAGSELRGEIKGIWAS